MGTTVDKLNRLINTKEGIRQELNRAYETEEISTSDTFDSYIQKLEEHPYYLKGLVEGTIENIKLSNITRIGEYAFSSCSSLANLNFPEVTRIGGNAFQGCSKLTEVSFPKAKSTGSYAFYNCSSLASVSFPNATGVDGYSFYNCSSLPSISLPEATELDVGAFYNSGLTEVSIPNATIINQKAFASCRSLTEVSFPKATSIGGNVFESCRGLTSVSLPKAKSIGEYAFRYCSSLTEVSFPVVTSIDGYAFQYCSSLTTIYVGTESDTVCTLSNTLAFNNCPNLTNIYVPANLVDDYKIATNWSSYADKIKVDIQPVECISLSITADDVAIGNATSTTIYYTAECTYTINRIPQEGTMVFTGEATSDSFEQNTSTTDTVQRTISFTFFGKTATATITQGVWSDKFIYVTTEGISDYGWVTADSKYNVDGYDVYMSNNKGKNSSQAVMKLECIGYTDLTLYIRSYAESSYDYTIASIANASTYPTDCYSSGVKAHTSGNQKSGTALSDYTKVEYTGLKDNDIIYIVFTKDSSSADGDDRGYVLIPKA